MISIGSMMSLNDSYYFDDNDDDMEMAPSPRFHRRNVSQGNMKVQGTITKITKCWFTEWFFNNYSLIAKWILLNNPKDEVKGITWQYLLSLRQMVVLA